jgi:hypothetical protein
VMVACLLLAIVVIAGAEYMYKAQDILAVQRSRRIALMAANSRLEDVKNLPYYTNLTRLLTGSSTVTNIKRNVVNGPFVTGSGEMVNIGGALLPIATTIQYVDADGVSPYNDCLRVTVAVGYRGVLTDRVVLETLRSPANVTLQ